MSVTKYKEKRLVSEEYGHFVALTTGDRPGTVHIATNNGDESGDSCGPWLTPDDIDDLVVMLLKAKRRATKGG